MRLKNGEVCLGWPLSQHILTQGWYYNDGSLHQAKPMLYTYTNYKAAYLDMTKLAAYDLWLADYRVGVNQKGKCQMWQYSSKGAVAGINGNCDMNWCYKAYASEAAGVSTPKPAQKAIVFKAGRWNVRKGPGTEYASVGVITSPDAKTGKVVTIGYSDVVNTKTARL